jgi:thioredoxin reductase
MSSTEFCDVAVVGAGPAGVAAAVVAAESGASVILVDSAEADGGQYYRRPRLSSVPRLGTAIHDWPAYDDLAVRKARLAVDHRLRTMHSTTVWSAAGRGPFRLLLRGNDRSVATPAAITARILVVATGAYDRTLPFHGWDLPGVMSCGAVQALVKGSGVLPGGRIIVAGTGPFLLAVAATVLEAGGTVAAVIEANAPMALLKHAHRMPGAWTKSRDLTRFLSLLARHQVPYLRRRRVIAANGRDQIESVTIARVDQNWHRADTKEKAIGCDTLAVSFGFAASNDLPLLLGAKPVLSADGGISIRVDTDQRTTIPGLLACGETTGIGGADLALAEGLIAGASAARAIGLNPRLSRRELTSLEVRIRRLRHVATALHATFPNRPGWTDELQPETLICRCEEVSVGSVRDALAQLGVGDVRSVKLMTRAGMGWCQGRICNYAVDQLCMSAKKPDSASTPRTLGGVDHRPLAAPVTLAELAAQTLLPTDQTT